MLYFSVAMMSACADKETWSFIIWNSVTWVTISCVKFCLSCSTEYLVNFKLASAVLVRDFCLPQSSTGISNCNCTNCWSCGDLYTLLTVGPLLEKPKLAIKDAFMPLLALAFTTSLLASAIL